MKLVAMLGVFERKGNMSEKLRKRSETQRGHLAQADRTAGVRGLQFSGEQRTPVVRCEES